MERRLFGSLCEVEVAGEEVATCRKLCFQSSRSFHGSLYEGKSNVVTRRAQSPSESQVAKLKLNESHPHATALTNGRALA